MTPKISDLIMQIELDLQILKDVLSYESNSMLAQSKIQKVLDKSATLSTLLQNSFEEITNELR